MFHTVPHPVLILRSNLNKTLIKRLLNAWEHHVPAMMTTGQQRYETVVILWRLRGTLKAGHHREHFRALLELVSKVGSLSLLVWNHSHFQQRSIWVPGKLLLTSGLLTRNIKIAQVQLRFIK
ncbi:hypothetical protein DPEC_G00163340 [Dallia pectoralis]|uniref:Uncharacterized protein n=1 Tax=Dallia pectoralis TaxID=75939 RepID=A0ACC2GGR9_DALPE|nr:hypothetical protein DPEC_G00163340 [Dallia pectoralis]